MRGTVQYVPIGVPVFNNPVLAGAEEVMRAGLEAQAGHAVLVRVQGAVAVAEVQAPDLDRLICTACGCEGKGNGDEGKVGKRECFRRECVLMND